MSVEALLLLAFLKRVLVKVEMSQLSLPLAVDVLVAETVVRCCGWLVSFWMRVLTLKEKENNGQSRFFLRGHFQLPFSRGFSSLPLPPH